jgi:hypothetical protein
MARFKYFLPMYPLGHKVSETSSTDITRGDADECIDLERSKALARRESDIVMVAYQENADFNFEWIREFENLRKLSVSVDAMLLCGEKRHSGPRHGFIRDLFQSLGRRLGVRCVIVYK